MTEVCDPEGRLWLNVLKMAVRDFVVLERCLADAPELQKDNHFLQNRGEIRNWFRSDSVATGSFQWICNKLGLNAGRALNLIEALPSDRTADLSGCYLPPIGTA
ncbi:MAG: hypothetical protein HQL50_03930 [Magnetococcales bacterium]|nr:hypothetical protein [Magnetococcales bacterium]